MDVAYDEVARVITLIFTFRTVAICFTDGLRLLSVLLHMEYCYIFASSCGFSIWMNEHSEKEVENRRQVSVSM